MEDKDILNIFQDILADPIYFGTEPLKKVKLTLGTKLRGDLRFEFLDCSQFAGEVEKRTGIPIAEKSDDFDIIGDYVNYIKPLLEAKEREEAEKGASEYYI